MSKLICSSAIDGAVAWVAKAEAETEVIDYSEVGTA